MHLPFILSAALLCAPIAWAQAVPSAEAARPKAEGNGHTGDAHAHHARLTWQQRFEQANTSHDGHLTSDQANGGYRSVARHFRELDSAGKGYITEDDVRAWHKARHAGHHPRERDAASRS
jgi:hypothetical protein